jgi:predicted RNase H-like HicB family nuclease
VRTTYKIEIFYSEKDKGYIAVAPDLPGCSVFGDTPAMAVKEMEIAQALWIETAKEIGKEIPEQTPINKPLIGDRVKRAARTIKAKNTPEQRVLEVVV